MSGILRNRYSAHALAFVNLMMRVGEPWISVLKNKYFWNAPSIKRKKQGVRRIHKRKTSSARLQCFSARWQTNSKMAGCSNARFDAVVCADLARAK